MTAFNALEDRILALSLIGSVDQPEGNPVVGLFKSQPAENHNGSYGLAGEPAKTAGGYGRAGASFGTAADGRVVNVDPITLTGLPAGTYTHFGVFGSTA